TRPLLSSPTTMPPGMHTLPLHVALPILVETLGRLARELRTATLAIGLQLTAYQVAVLVGVDIGKALGQAGGVGFQLADPAVAVGIQGDVAGHPAVPGHAGMAHASVATAIFPAPTVAFGMALTQLTALELAVLVYIQLVELFGQPRMLGRLAAIDHAVLVGIQRERPVVARAFGGVLVGR